MFFIFSIKTLVILCEILLSELFHFLYLLFYPLKTVQQVEAKLLISERPTSFFLRWSIDIVVESCEEQGDPSPWSTRSSWMFPSCAALEHTAPKDQSEKDMHLFRHLLSLSSISKDSRTFFHVYPVENNEYMHLYEYIHLLIPLNILPHLDENLGLCFALLHSRNKPPPRVPKFSLEHSFPK